MNHSQFESLMEKAPLGYAYQKMITDSQSNPFDYRVLMCNNLFERITGVKKANLINRKISEINLSEDFHKFNRMELFNKIAFQGSQESFEAYSQALSVWFHVCVFSPEKGFFITFYTDITDHKVDLKQYENFFDINLDLLCIADKDGRFIKLNKEWEQLLGYNIEELQGRSFLDFIHPDDLHPTKEAMKRLENDEDILNFTNRYRTKNGEYKIIEWRSHPHQGLMYGAARDITKQKKANLELERREKQFSSLFMDSPVSIMIHDKESAQIIEANKKALSVYGVQQVEELNAQDFFGEPPYAQADAIKMMQKVIKEGPQEFEWLSKRKSGDLFWEKVNLKLMNYNGEERIMATSIDINQHKEAQRKAESAGRAKSEFLSNMSHEIRTPLNGIIGFTDLLKSTDLNASQKQFLQSVSSNANFLLDIVNDILDFSQIEEGKLKLELAFSNLHKLLNDCIESIHNKASKKGLELFLNCENDLPKYIYVDASRLKQILINLLSNAVKFTEKGRIEMKVAFSNITSGVGSFLFSVKDSGIGMKEAQQSKLFKAFSQGDASTTKRFGGMGLGLILSQRIAQKMGSKINFESRLKKGTTFYFQLQTPYKRIQDEAPTPISVIAREDFDSKNQNVGTLSNIKEKLTLLIVDDVETSRFLFSEYMKEFDQNIRILEATNGEQALKITKRENPDLILMDLFMPVLDGLSATKMIREYENQNSINRTVIFALTATATKEQEQECYHAGMDAYLTKPVKKDQLHKKICEFLKNTHPGETAKKVKQRVLDQSVDDEFAIILETLKKMLQRNDLSAIDYLNNNNKKLVDLGDPKLLKKIKRSILDLKYNEAINALEKMIVTFPESSKRGQKDG